MRKNVSKRLIGGTHEREDIPHYHFSVKYPNGRSQQISDAQHCISAPARPSYPGEPWNTTNCAVTSWTVKTLVDEIREKLYENKDFDLYIGINDDSYLEKGPITYYKVYELGSIPVSTKLRDLRFDKQGFGSRTLKRMSSRNTFIVVYKDQKDLPRYDYLKDALDARVATEEEKDPNEPDTRPPSPEISGGKKTRHLRQNKKRKTKRRVKKRISKKRT